MIGIAGTLGILALFIVIGCLPKVPWWAKVVIQLIIGAVIYIAFSDKWFEFPYGDTLPISMLAGGNAGSEGFAYLSMGVLGTVIGLLFTALATVVGLLLKKKES